MKSKKRRHRYGAARRISAAALSAAMVLSAVPAVNGAATVYADDNPNTGNPVPMVSAEESSHYSGEKNYFSNEEYDQFGLALNSPAEFDPNDTSNPMGGAVGEKRVTQQLDELFMARGNYDSNHWAGWLTVMEDVKNANSSELSFMSMINRKYGGKEDYYHSEGGSQFSHLGIKEAKIQTASSTALDMDGDGTDELAMDYLLLDESNDMSYRLLRVYDYANDGTPKVIAEQAFPLAAGNDKNSEFVEDIELESAHGLASVTAGDYDHDGKDEIAVYNPQHGTWRSHVEIFEVSATGMTMKQRIPLENLVSDNRFSQNYNEDWYVPMCTLSTTSISGQDDLVINAIDPWYSGGSTYSRMNHNESFSILRYDGREMKQVLRSDLAYNGQRLLFTSSTDGDLNGNGQDELLVGGYWSSGGSMDKNSNGLMAFCWNAEKNAYEAAWSGLKQVPANSAIGVNKDMQAPSTIAAAKVVSYIQRDAVFLNGVLLTAQNTKVTEGAQEKDELANATFKEVARYNLHGDNKGAFIHQVAAGHFVKGSINEEQICVISGDYQSTNADHINLDYGFVYRNLTEQEKTPDFNPESKANPDEMATWNITADVTSNDFYSKMDEDDNGTYVCICPLNVDHDTYEYTYLGKEDGWSAPTLYSVVNAMPYWKEVSYKNNTPGSESWTIKVGDNTSNSGTAGIEIGAYLQMGFAVQAGIFGNYAKSGIAARFDAGVSWAGTWAKNHATMDTLAISLAPNKNYAIVYAMPVVNYRYMMHSPETEVTQAMVDEYKDNSEFTYKVGDVIPEKDEEMQVVQQMTPSFSAVPVDTYNGLADKYDMDKIRYGINKDGDRNYIPERTIGDPTTYAASNDAFAEPSKFQDEDDKDKNGKSTNGKFTTQVNTNQSSTISHEESDTYTETHNVTARLNASIGVTNEAKGGFIVKANGKLDFGGKFGISGGYTHSQGDVRGVTYGATFSSLPAGCEDYGYSVTLALYDLPGAKDIEGNNNGDDFSPNGKPFVLDYVVSGLRQPYEPEVNLNLRTLGTTSDSVVLKWDNPTELSRKADHYEIYVMSGTNAKLIGTAPSTENVFIVNNLDPDRNYEFKMKAVGNAQSSNTAPVSVFSSPVTAQTQSGSVRFTKQPASGSVEADGSYRLTAEALPVNGSTPISYQWQKAAQVNGVETFTDIKGATDVSYDVPAGDLAEGQAAEYRVYANLNGRSYDGAYSNVATVVRKQNGVNYADTTTELTSVKADDSNHYTITAKVTSGNQQPVTTGNVLFYSVPADANRETANTTVIRNVRLSGDGTASASLEAPENGVIVGARFLAGGDQSGSYYFTSLSNEINLKADKYVRLTYELNGGTNAAENPDPIILTKDSEIIKLADPQREGYTFDSWMLNGSKVTEIDPAKVTENGVIYATWKPQEYAISYQLGGGRSVSSMLSKYTVKTNVPLRQAVREGYTFEGWYLDEAHTKPVKELSQGANKGVITLYAAWKKKPAVSTEMPLVETGLAPADTSGKDNTPADTDQPTVTPTPKPADTADKGGKKDETTDKPDATKVKRTTVYRVYNPNSGEHFYTTSKGEKNTLVKLGWKDEGTGWYAPSKSSKPIYRLYNANAGDHHYTTSVGERKALVKLGWKYEGITCYSADEKDAYSAPVYREYNPNAKAGAHNFTLNSNEHNMLIRLGWKNENIAWYAIR